MRWSKYRSWKSAALFGVGLALVASGVLPFFELALLRAGLIAAGLLVIAARLVVLQLALYREGDRRWSDGAGSPAPPAGSPAPAELRNPRYRAIWEHMGGARRAMARHEAAALEREHRRLDLSAEEQLLFMGDRAAPLFWPVVLGSLFALAVSAMTSAPEAGWRGFTLLGIGLGGLLYLAVFRGRVRYYLTSHRVLVRNRATFRGTVTWTSLSYPLITRCESRPRLAGGRILLTGDGATAELAGLNPAELQEVGVILRERLPEEARDVAGFAAGCN